MRKILGGYDNPKIIFRNPATKRLNEQIFRDQFAYGHRELLLDYLNLDHSHGLVGRLQHGITPNIKNINFRTPFWGLRQLPFWVYSHYLEDIAKLKGHSHVIAIGSPWNYLRHNKLSKTQKTGRILVMPDHSTSKYIDQASTESIIQRAKAFRNLIGTNADATVCLYYLDFLDRGLRHAYQDLGFKVETLGAGNTLIPASSAGNRKSYLHNLSDLLHQHDVFISDTFSTPALYAISYGLQIGIYENIQDYRALIRMGQPIPSNHFKVSNLFGSHELHLMKTLLKKNFGQVNPVSEANVLLNHFLGSDILLSPVELKHALKMEPSIY